MLGAEKSKTKVKAFELKNKTSKELLKELEDFKHELSTLKVAKATGAAAAKLARIKVVRKNIARTLTVYNQKLKEDAKKTYITGKKYAAKYVPQDLRPKKTRALRRALSKKQQSAVATKVAVRKANFPLRKYAVMA